MALPLTHPLQSAEAPVTGIRPSLSWSDVALIGIFLILASAVLVIARELVIPLVSAMVVGSMIGPLADKLQARGLPTPVTALLLVLMLMGAGYGLVLAMVDPVTNWIARGPELQALLQERLQIIQRPIARMQELIGALSRGGESGRPPTVSIASSDWIGTVAGVLTPAIGVITHPLATSADL